LSEKYIIGIFLAKDKYFLQPGETRKSGGFALDCGKIGTGDLGEGTL